jgi:pyruvate,water dikinase
MERYVIALEEAAALSRAGGKGLNLGELLRVGGLNVPPGFCVTTEAYRKVSSSIPDLNEAIRRLDELSPEDRDGIGKSASRVRALFENAPIPADIASEITKALEKLKTDAAFAVRSSATAEDLPDASFAGQQDTYLNVSVNQVLPRVRQCWGSLFTDRAAAYRIRSGFGHRSVALAVIVQTMIFPQAAGILFTADPVSGNRKVSVIDAGFGLGEAMVSGVVAPDNYRVKDGKILSAAVGLKKIQIVPAEGGGTREETLPIEQRESRVLTDEQIAGLCRTGRKIEEHYAALGKAAPQDIEWCLADGKFHILQSRPITTLYPLPEGEFKDGLHVFVCSGHMQMMTDVILPLGLSFYQALVGDYADMVFAGGRLYMDVSSDLRSWWGRKMLLYSFGETDVLVRKALEDLLKDKDVLRRLGKSGSWIRAFKWDFFGWVWKALKLYLRGDMSGVRRAAERYDAVVAAKRAQYEKLSGEALFDVLMLDMANLYKEYIEESKEDAAYLMLWLYGHKWLQKNMKKWLGEEHAVDVLSKSVPGNPTSEMGLALLDLACMVRGRPAVVEYLERAKDEDFIEGLREADEETAEAFSAFLEKYGMRCSGEIDIAKPRWNERPTTLTPMIEACIKSEASGVGLDGAARFERGRAEAEAKAEELIARLEKLPGGRRKARKTRKMITVWRGVSGFREHPKFYMIRLFGVYKGALLREAGELVKKGAICEREDIFYLTLEELREASRTGRANLAEIERRKKDYAFFEKLTPPRVMTSEGEVLRGSYGAPPRGALAGMPVSAGVVEGTARVVLRQEDARIRPGDILVTPFTDPSWTPFFVSVKGLVTEVGGQMTHGAVITREYGLPAVVGVEDATKKIADGRRIRVNGTEGWVEILETRDN